MISRFSETRTKEPFGLEARDLRVDLPQADGSTLRVLNGIDLSVTPGEFVSIVGPSGCGKTTLLRTVARLVRPSSGSIHGPTNGKPTPLALGMVFQRPNLLPWLTIAGNTALPWTMAGLTPPVDFEHRINSVLSAVGLYGFRNAFPSELSGGMQMRASLARAFVTNPQLLLLDEAFSGLDEATRDTVTDELLALWASTYCSVIFVTHSLTDAVYLSDRVLVLSQRPTRVIYDHPITLPRPRQIHHREDPIFFEHVKAIRRWVRHE
jgi:NitT/TauT family transport system ATP-binding protein